jgi:hypothetical protein
MTTIVLFNYPLKIGGRHIIVLTHNPEAKIDPFLYFKGNNIPLLL